MAIKRFTAGRSQYCAYCLPTVLYYLDIPKILYQTDTIGLIGLYVVKVILDAVNVLKGHSQDNKGFKEANAGGRASLLREATKINKKALVYIS
jgi:hypothetical protein